MLRVLLSCIAIGASSAASACEQPKLFVFPNAKDLGEDLSIVLIAMQDYVDGMNGYVNCVQAELTAAGGDAAPAQLRAMLTRRNNTAVGETKAIVALFTERVGPIEMLRLTEFVRSGKEDCVSTLHVTGQAVLDERTVLLLEQDGTGHLNLLEEKCPLVQLNHAFGPGQDNSRAALGDVLGPTQRSFPMLGARLCSNEFIYPYDSNGVGPLGAACALGPFFHVSKEQVKRLGVKNDATRPSDNPPAKRKQ